MRSKTTIIGAVIILFLAAVTASSTPSQKVVRHPKPESYLRERWEWGMKQAKARDLRQGCWIGYSIEKLMGENSYMGSWSSKWEDEPTLSEIVYGVKPERIESELSNGEIIRRAAREVLVELESEKEGRSPKKVLKEIAILFQYGSDQTLDRVRMSNLSLRVDLEDLALIWLGKAGNEESVGLLSGLYGGTSDDEAKEKLVAAVGIHPPSDPVLSFLERILKSKETDDVREKAAFWLGQQDDKKALGILMKTANEDCSIGVREKAVFAISQLGIDEATDGLIDLANNAGSSAVREKAVFWLGQGNDSRALKALLDIVKDDLSGEVREKAVFAISQMKRDEATDALINLAHRAKYQNVREKVVFWLGQKNDPRGLKTLLDIANSDPSLDVREKAVFGISQMRSDEATEALIDLAYHAKSHHVREKAVFWLGQKASKKAAKALENVAYEGEDTEIQKQAVFAISQLPRDEGIPKLIEISKTHPSVEIRKKAIFWLGQSKDPRALDALVDIIRGH